MSAFILTQIVNPPSGSTHSAFSQMKLVVARFAVVKSKSLRVGVCRDVEKTFDRGQTRDALTVCDNPAKTQSRGENF